LNFLDCSPDDKRLIIKNFLNLEDIFDMRDRIKSFKSQYNQSIKQQDAVVREHQSTISSLDEKIVNIAQMKEDYDSYDSSFLSLSLEDVIDQEVKEHERQAKLSALTRTLHLSSKDFNSLTYRLKNVDALRVCPTCNQEVLEKEDKESLLSNIAKLQKEEIELKKEYSNVSSRTYAPAVSSKDFAKLISYKELCRDEINYQEIRTEIQHKIEEAELRKINNQASYDVMRFWEKALSEHGLIKYIIRNILDFFNEKANYYLSYLSDGGYSIQFDEELSEKIETGKRIVPYISLSGGEQRKINLAVMLSLKDLLLFTDKNQSDIIFFDEVAENLDEQGVAGLYSLLQEIKKDKTIFVITHNKYLKTLLDSAPRLAIIKEKGTSHILEI
jgi:DNA repair exonuclease SbcCD ATPase subunit